MDDFLEAIGTILKHIFYFIALVLLGIIYLPAFLITTLLNKTWGKLLKEFGL